MLPEFRVDEINELVGKGRWVWDLVDSYVVLSHDDQIEFWFQLHQSRLSSVACAELFWAVWTSQRYWDTDAVMARRLLTVFNQIESDAEVFDGVEAQALVARFRLACPHVFELQVSMDQWSEYLLPIERLGLV